MSRLTRAQRNLLRVSVALGVFMVGNALYLLCYRLGDWLGWHVLVPSETFLPTIYQIILLSHTAAGLLLAAIVLSFAVWHLTRVWPLRRNRVALAAGLLTVALGLVLAVSGLLILSEANTRANQWAFWTHVVCALLVPTLYILHRAASRTRPAGSAYRASAGTAAAMACVALIAHGISGWADGGAEDRRAAALRSPDARAGSGARDLSDHADEAGFAAAGKVPAASPFFPSPATTTSGRPVDAGVITGDEAPHPDSLRGGLDRYGFAANARIGSQACDRCHPDVVAQWAVSAHRFASFNNPFYEATVNLLRKQAGNDRSRWCGGCHDPALMLTGAMAAKIDRRTPDAQAGLTCMACHGIDRIHNLTGNGNYNIADEVGDPYLFSDSKDGVGLFVHDTVLKARPTAHKRRMRKPSFGRPEYCATCHKVSLDTPVNDYRWLRGQNEYDAWHDSGVSWNASRTFYLPSARLVCQDCHMPREPAVLGDVSAREGAVRSHRFLAANTALPFVRGDAEMVSRTEAFLRAGRLSVDLLALRVVGESGDPLMLPAVAEPPALRPGDEVQVDVVVRNQGVGHTFPGGTNDSNEGWLELALLDGKGTPVAASGHLEADGHVDPASHFFRALLLDSAGTPIRKRNAQDIRAEVYTHAIGPGTADIVRYRFRVEPEWAGKTVTLQVRLLWRKFGRTYTEFVYRANPEGFKAFSAVPELPITEIVSDRVRLDVLHEGNEAPRARPDPPDRLDWRRLNDYGIGLLLQGDTRAAAWAFQKVAETAPERLDGHRNLARVAVADGDVDTAFRHLERCEEIRSADAQTAWVWGTALQEAGRYDEAAAAYERVLQDFPGDRQAWKNLGRVRYLKGSREGALAALDRALAIDPEDRMAHYHRMLALRALGRRNEAMTAEAAYRKYQIDESAREVTRAFLLEHPDEERESQRIHTHTVSVWRSDGRRLANGAGR